MYGETFYGRHTAQHQLQWRQIKIKNDFRAMKTFCDRRWVIVSANKASKSILATFSKNSSNDISTLSLCSFIAFWSSKYFCLYFSTSSSSRYSSIVFENGGNGNPNLHIVVHFLLQVLECLCVCKLTKLTVSSLSILHVRYLSINWTFSFSDFYFSNVGAFLSKQVCEYEKNHAVEIQLYKRIFFFQLDHMHF